MFNFLPKDDKFFDQLDTIARVLVSSTERLSALLQTGAIVWARLLTFPGAAAIGALGYWLGHFALQPFIRN